jgi:hypothetical protein
MEFFNVVSIVYNPQPGGLGLCIYSPIDKVRHPVYFSLNSMTHMAKV